MIKNLDIEIYRVVRPKQSKMTITAGFAPGSFLRGLHVMPASLLYLPKATLNRFYTRIQAPLGQLIPALYYGLLLSWQHSASSEVLYTKS